MNSAVAGPEKVFDRDAALHNLGGDADLLKEIAQLFVADWPQNRSQILDALDAGDAPRMRTSVHAVKGAASNFGAAQAVALSLELESSCKRGDLALARTQVDGMLEAVEELATALDTEFGD